MTSAHMSKSVSETKLLDAGWGPSRLGRKGLLFSTVRDDPRQVLRDKIVTFRKKAYDGALLK